MNANVNPFRSARVEQIRYALPSESLESLSNKAIQAQMSCLLGPHGTGKSTLLEDLKPYFLTGGHSIEHIYLNTDSSREERSAAIASIASMNRQTVCLFDGAEIMSRWQWSRICKAARAQSVCLIATLHKPRAMHVLHETTPDWSLAKEFVQQLAASHANKDLIAEAKRAFDKNKGNMREVFRSCYLYLAQNPSETF